MDNKYHISFINAMTKVLQTMLRTEVSFDKPFLKKRAEPSHEVSGIIGFSGNVFGTIVVSFPEKVAGTLVERFVGEAIDPAHPDFVDAIGEMVNMIAGGAKATFGVEDIHISCPTVIMGSNYQVFQLKDCPIIAIPCTCDVGCFVAEIALKQSAQAQCNAA